MGADKMVNILHDKDADMASLEGKTIAVIGYGSQGSAQAQMMKESGVNNKTCLCYGQMNEPPGARLRVGLSALTMAEYFRDTSGADVLLFIDNPFLKASHLGGKRRLLSYC